MNHRTTLWPTISAAVGLVGVVFAGWLGYRTESELPPILAGLRRAMLQSVEWWLPLCVLLLVVAVSAGAYERSLHERDD